MNTVAFSFVFDKYCPIMEAQKICLINSDQTVQLVFIFVYI